MPVKTTNPANIPSNAGQNPTANAAGFVVKSVAGL